MFPRAILYLSIAIISFTLCLDILFIAVNHQNLRTDKFFLLNHKRLS